MTRLHHLALFSAVLTTAYSQLLPDTAPDKTQEGQTGTNKCGTDSSQTSMCQNAFINSVDDFCLYAPPQPGPGSVIGNTEREEVSWCTKSGKGTRLIPDGAITGAHFIQTPDFVQITGIGDLTKLNIPTGDQGGELDPHGADGNGNPIGGLVFSSAFGQLQQIKEWTNFMSDTMFCFRACKPGPRAAEFCQHIYDVMGCEWNMPADYAAGFDSCKGDSGEPMGVYGASTFHQGDAVTPSAHPRPASSGCATTNTIGNGVVVPTTSTTSSVHTSPSAVTTTTLSRTAANSPSSTAASGSGSAATSRTGVLTSPPGTATGTGTAPGQNTSASSSSSGASRISVDAMHGLMMTVGSILGSSVIAAFILL